MSDNSDKSYNIGPSEVLHDDNHRVDKPEAIIRRVVEKKYPNLSYEKTSEVIHHLVEQPGDVKIRAGDEDIRVDSLTEYVADMIERMNASESDGGDNPLSEYYQWIESGQKVLSHMNDGFISHDDLTERNELLTEFDQREVDLMTCVMLYRRCNLEDPRVKRKYDEINRKLVKLREIRSSIITSTKDKADEKPQNAAEKARDGAVALVYIGVLDRLKREALNGDAQISDEKKRSLNIYFEPHVNSAYILSSIRADLQNKNRFQESLAERLLQKREEKQALSLENIQQKLAKLSGRVQPMPSTVGKSVDGTNRTFDINRYMMLKEKEELMRA